MDAIVNTYKTPFYLFDTEILKKRIAYLHEQLTAHLVYAIKANPFIAGSLINAVERYEICSLGEMQICMDQQVPFEKMVISGVNKDDAFIAEIVKHPIKRVTIESLHQYESLKAAAQKNKRSFQCLLRLSSGNQFGMSEEEVHQICTFHDPEMEIIGLEYFSGTQKHALKKIHKECVYLHDFISDLPIPIKELEYGPGLNVSYFGDFDEAAYLQAIREELTLFDMPVYIESGRSIAASCGFYVTSVMDLKTTKNTHYAIVDGGIHQLTYYGGMMGMHIPKLEHYPHKEGPTQHYTICGSLCTTNDILIRNIALTDLAIKDQLIFKDAGAYAMCEGISLFLSRELPAILIKNEKTIQVVRDHTPTATLNGGK